MLKSWQTNLIVLFVILAAAYTLSFGFSPEYKICSPSDYTRAKECTEHYLGNYGFLWIVAVLDAHNGLLTAIATVFVAGFTWTLWQSSEKMWGATTQAAGAASETAISTRAAVIAGNRAWLRPNLYFGGPLTIDNNGISSVISIEMVNVGNSPANHVNFSVWMEPWSNAMPANRLLKERSDEIRRPGTGFSLFPGERFPADKGLGGMGASVRATRASCEAAIAEGDNPKKIVPLYVFGCITYTFASDPIGKHQTRFIYEVSRNPLSARRVPFIVLEDEIIPRNDLRLIDTPMGFGQEAD